MNRRPLVTIRAGVLPALVDELDAIAVGVEHVSGIMWIIVKPRA